MTDRLKAWLDEARNCPTDHAAELYAALRAVVELHRGQESTFGVGYTSQQERLVMCAECDEEWPCSTIKAIEKEVIGAE